MSTCGSTYVIGLATRAAGYDVGICGNDVGTCGNTYVIGGLRARLATTWVCVGMTWVHMGMRARGGNLAISVQMILMPALRQIKRNRTKSTLDKTRKSCVR